MRWSLLEDRSRPLNRGERVVLFIFVLDGVIGGLALIIMILHWSVPALHSWYRGFDHEVRPAALVQTPFLGAEPQKVQVVPGSAASVEETEPVYPVWVCSEGEEILVTVASGSWHQQHKLSVGTCTEPVYFGAGATVFVVATDMSRPACALTAFLTGDWQQLPSAEGIALWSTAVTSEQLTFRCEP